MATKMKRVSRIAILGVVILLPGCWAASCEWAESIKPAQSSREYGGESDGGGGEGGGGY